MRQRPVGTGPLKFVEFKPNEINQSRAQSRLREARPAHLDGIEYTVIRNTSTAILALARISHTGLVFGRR